MQPPARWGSAGGQRAPRLQGRGGISPEQQAPRKETAAEHLWCGQAPDAACRCPPRAGPPTCTGTPSLTLSWRQSGLTVERPVGAGPRAPCLGYVGVGVKTRSQGGEMPAPPPAPCAEPPRVTAAVRVDAQRGRGDSCHGMASCGAGAGESELPVAGHPAGSWCCSRRPAV